METRFQRLILCITDKRIDDIIDAVASGQLGTDDTGEFRFC